MPENLKFAHRVRRLVVLALPLFLSFGWITLVIGPAYPRYEYGRPDFPPDLAGMSPVVAPGLELVPLTPAERLELALVAVAYLESWQPAEAAIARLAKQKLPHAKAPLYNQRELTHLIEVKRITDTIRLWALGTAVPAALGLAFLLARSQTRRLGYLALGQAGLATVIILSGVSGFILWGWGLFFFQFHGLLFPAGTWTFAATDSLMRLYPERFFFDVGLVMSLGIWLWGLLLALTGYLLAWHQLEATGSSRRGTHVQKAVQ